MKKKFIKHPSRITASSEVSAIPSWISEDAYEILMDRVYDYMFSHFNDAKYFLKHYKSGDDSEARDGTGGPSATFDSIVYSFDTWETMPKYMDSVHYRLRDDEAASRWFKNEIVDIYEANASEYPKAEEWLNILKEYGTF